MSRSSPKFLIKPRTQYVKEGDTATLRCSRKGQPPPKVTWEKDGRKIIESHKYRLYTSNQFSCLDIVNVDITDRGIFVCTITNSCGEASVPVDVDVSEAEKETSLESGSGEFGIILTAAEGPETDIADDRQSATYWVGLGVSPTTIQIPADVGLNPAGGSFTILSGRGSQAMSPRFTKHLDREHEVFEGETIVIEVKSVSWFDEQEPHVLPRFTRPLENCDVLEGDAVILECRATPATESGEATRAPSFSTQLRDEIVNEGDCVTLTCLNPNSSEAQNADVRDNDEDENGGETIENVNFPLISAADGESIGFDGHGPAVPPQFVKGLANQVVTEGDSLTIECITDAGGGGIAAYESSERRQVSGTSQNEGDALANIIASGAEAQELDRAPLFVIQLPSALTLDEGADMDLSCRVNRRLADSPRSVGPEIASF